MTLESKLRALVAELRSYKPMYSTPISETQYKIAGNIEALLAERQEPRMYSHFLGAQ